MTHRLATQRIRVTCACAIAARCAHACMLLFASIRFPPQCISLNEVETPALANKDIVEYLGADGGGATMPDGARAWDTS